MLDYNILYKKCFYIKKYKINVKKIVLPNVSCSKFHDDIKTKYEVIVLSIYVQQLLFRRQTVPQCKLGSFSTLAQQL